MMWEWIFHECERILKFYALSKEDRDEILQETMVHLFDCPDVAETIYTNRSSAKGMGYLKAQINFSVLENRASRFFDNKRDYSAYKKVLLICEKYNIYPLPENAYKIAPLMSEPRECTIASIEKLLGSVKPSLVSLDALVENGVAKEL